MRRTGPAIGAAEAGNRKRRSLPSPQRLHETAFAAAGKGDNRIDPETAKTQNLNVLTFIGPNNDC